MHSKEVELGFPNNWWCLCLRKISLANTSQSVDHLYKDGRQNHLKLPQPALEVKLSRNGQVFIVAYERYLFKPTKLSGKAVKF